MSGPRLPLEISDYIVDLLHGQSKTLKNCCLVSKSWIPRAREHLFGAITFDSLIDLKVWKDTFPDPLNSPARCTHSLYINSEEVIPAVVVGESDWIQAFSNVVHLDIWVSVSENLSTARLFNVVCSLPLLEDLGITCQEISDYDDGNTILQSSTSPPLTGTLRLYFPSGMEPTVCRLLELPNGVHFRKLECTWHLQEDLQWIMAVMEECSNTLKCVDIQCRNSVFLEESSVDFSEVIGLEEVVFRFEGVEEVWAALALKTITSKHTDFRKVAIHLFPARPSTVGESVRQTMGEEIYEQWMDLDHVLVRLWETNATHTQVVYSADQEEKEAREHMCGLLPEMTRRGIVEMVIDCLV